MDIPTSSLPDRALHIKAQRVADRRYDTRSTSSYQDRADLAQNLREDAEAVLHIYYDLLHLSNAQTPACSLIPEIFLHIVGFLAMDVPPWIRISGPHGRVDRSLGWARITQVCRHWRNTCRGVQELWPLSTGHDGVLNGTGFFAYYTKDKPLTAPETFLLGSTIRTMSLDSLHDLNFDAVLDMLTQLPVLANLLLDRCVFNASIIERGVPTTVAGSRPRVILPKIRTLRLLDISCQPISDFTCYDFIQWFLASLQIPATTKLRLRLTPLVSFGAVSDDQYHTLSVIIRQITRTFEMAGETEVSVFIEPLLVFVTLNTRSDE
ncbi:hypothetical protein PENSPDRAFT_691561 [Peniophora sp. CONT]|nr:hypothetical protein PENSPDRAFT_691561 [Peniophora sp. CONT]